MEKIDKKKFRVLTVMILLIFSLNVYPNDPSQEGANPKEETKPVMENSGSPISNDPNTVSQESNSKVSEDGKTVTTTTTTTKVSEIKVTHKRKGIKLAEDIDGLKALDEAQGIGKRYAIIIGINKYSDSGISQLSKARNDAKAVHKIFSEYGHFDSIALMTDDADPGDSERLFPTKQNIEYKIRSYLSTANSNDMFIFFFSGHGISNGHGDNFLITQDTNLINKEKEALAVNWVVDEFKKKNIKKVLLMLDACRETVYTTKSVSRDDIIPKDFNEGNVSATFYSTKQGHFSYEDDESDYGVFTKYLIYGMEGKADTDDDGVVSFSDLKKYVEKGVMDWSRKKGKTAQLSQVPYTKIYNEEVNGDLAITLAKKPKDSLADDNEFSRTWDQALKRSAIFPGYGQYFKKEKYKAYFFGASSLFLLGGLASTYSSYQSAKSNYSSAMNNEFLFSAVTTDFGALNLFALSQTNQARSVVESRSSAIAGVSTIFAGVYLINLIDSVIMKKPKASTVLGIPDEGFRFTYRREVQPFAGIGTTGQVGNFGLLEYYWNF
ncbi:MAG: caspase family protein [Leptospiraceae bacterium]|nr:caspase family protein [Leptospiraceae bacterium]MCP5512415.1 caspase family protein [Leptospiraceae bacterium]